MNVKMGYAIVDAVDNIVHELEVEGQTASAIMQNKFYIVAGEQFAIFSVLVNFILTSALLFYPNPCLINHDVYYI